MAAEIDQDGTVRATDPAHQARFGLALALAIIAAWAVVHIWTVFFFELSWARTPEIIALIALQCWLYTGMFIVAHDCMHGSLVPFQPWANRLVGQVCLGLYAGFSFDELNRNHHRHHRHPGTGEDPDFDDHPPYGFWRWYLKFFTEYFAWRQAAYIFAVYMAYLFVFGASPWNALVFWAGPSLLSSLQLFTFGTYLPHRPARAAFVDRHRTRSNDYSWIVSLLTCFHFGYHHEHHLHPTVPWWRLPGMREKG